MITVLRGAYVVGHRNDDHVIIDDGEIAFEDNTIIYVGNHYSGPRDVEIDTGRSLIGPGFIDLDALADIDHAQLDAFGSRELRTGYDWSTDYFANRRHEVFSDDELDFMRDFAIVQLLLHGVTTAMPIAAEMHRSWAETSDEMHRMAAIAQHRGLRMYLGPSYRGGVNTVGGDGSTTISFDENQGRAGLAEAVTFLETLDPNLTLITPVLLPCRIETMTPDLLRGTAAAAQEHDCLVRIHALQSAAEISDIQRMHQTTPLQLLHDTGLLGPHLLLVHGIFIDGYSGRGDIATPGQEIKELVRAGTSLVHCPLTSARDAEALETFDRYRSSGLTIALGSDSYPPDLIRAMDYGNNVAKILTHEHSAGSPADYYRAATLGGATALRRPDLGRLAPGCRADITVIGMDTPRTGPVDDPIRALLMNTTAANVTQVFVDGRHVVVDGTIPGMDFEVFNRRAADHLHKMKASYTERDYQKRSSEELFPPSFPRAPWYEK